VPTVRTDPALGLIVQIILIAILAGTVGVGAAGWVTGITYGAFVYAALTLGMNRVGAGVLGPADRVTLARAALVGCVLALVADSYGRPVPVAPLVAIAVVALVLDAVDGYVARRTGTTSPLGARFDMEVDAFLILVLSVYLARPLGAWVLAIGLMRYALLVAGWALEWLRRPVPPRYWRKVVAAVQGIVLVVASAAILPTWLNVAALVAALALLVESFGRDVIWSWRHRTRQPTAAGPRPSTMDTHSLARD
jgi:phosphatidylglycerophosphate synthase